MCHLKKERCDLYEPRESLKQDYEDFIFMSEKSLYPHKLGLYNLSITCFKTLKELNT